MRVDEDFVDHYRSLVKTYYNERLEPMPDVKCFLEANNLPICIASSAPKKKSCMVLRLPDYLAFLVNRQYLAHMKSQLEARAKNLFSCGCFDGY